MRLRVGDGDCAVLQLIGFVVNKHLNLLCCGLIATAIGPAHFGAEMANTYRQAA
jgi:hypothetical protein